MSDRKNSSSAALVLGEATGTRPFSIIVPTYKRPMMLRRLVASLREHLAPEALELILVNDHPEDDLPSILADPRTSFPIVYTTTPGIGPASARNRGVELATGDYLVFTDDDCIVAAGWLDELKRRLDEGYAAVGGRSAATGDSIVERYYDRMRLFDPGRKLDGSIQYVLSNNLIVRRHLLTRIGGFDSRFARPGGEDSELCYRIRHDGGRLGYSENAVVYHDYTPSTEALIRRYYNYGVGHRTIFEMHGSSEHYMLDPDVHWSYLVGERPTVNGIEPMDEDEPLFGVLTFLKTISFTAGYLCYYDVPSAVPAAGRSEELTSSLLSALGSTRPVADVQDELVDRFPEAAAFLKPALVRRDDWWTTLARSLHLGLIFEVYRGTGPRPDPAPGPPRVDESTRRQLEARLFEEFNVASARCADVLREILRAGAAPTRPQLRSLCDGAALDSRYFERWLAWLCADETLVEPLRFTTVAEIARLRAALAVNDRRRVEEQ